MKSILTFLIALIIIVFSSCTSSSVKEINLEGEWIVKLDSLNVGIDKNWASNKFNGTTIQLPGTLDDAELGNKNRLQPAMNNYVLSGLTRKHQYIGAAWYQKEVNIPDNWEGKNMVLELERIIWESQLFVDGKRIGKEKSLITPHHYDLSKALTPGKHTFTIRIDNSNKYPLINVKGNRYPDPVNQDMAHAYTNHTQIKWNGIIGDLKLIASEKNNIENLQVYSNVLEGTIKATFKNNSNSDGELNYQILSTDGEIITEGIVEKGKEEIILQKPDGIEVWDEFHPNLYDFQLLTASEATTTRFGYRQIQKENGVLTLNEKRIFLRGNLECAIFPLTGSSTNGKRSMGNLNCAGQSVWIKSFTFSFLVSAKSCIRSGR